MTGPGLTGHDRRILDWLAGGEAEAVPAERVSVTSESEPPGVTAAAPLASRVRPLTDHEQAAVIAVAIATAGVAVLGFANSFSAVMAAAWLSFGRLAPTVPLGIDLGIAIFAGLDIVLARLDMRLRWVRLVPWALTAATIWLNVAGQHAWFGRVAHAVLPGMWVLAVEAGAHVIRVRARLSGGTAMDRIRPSRWLLAPLRTAGLWRRMVLWEVRSYPLALARERDRVIARTGLQDAHGAVAWRWRAPRRVRALYRLGELVPAPEPLALTAAASAPDAPRLPASVTFLAPPRGASGAADADALPDAPPAAAPEPAAELNGHAGAAVELFAAELADGTVPGLRAIQQQMRIGQPRAQLVQQYLRQVAARQDRQEGGS